MSRLAISTTSDSAVSIYRDAHRVMHLVYIAVANKKLGYTYGSSKIVYIGTTERGVARITESAAERSEELLAIHGVISVDFSCTRKQKVRTWEKLERSLLIKFREMFGEMPWGNTQGVGLQWDDELEYFSEDRLRGVIEKYSNI